MLGLIPRSALGISSLQITEPQTRPLGRIASIQMTIDLVDIADIAGRLALLQLVPASKNISAGIEFRWITCIYPVSVPK